MPVSEMMTFKTVQSKREKEKRNTHIIHGGEANDIYTTKGSVTSQFRNL